MNAMKVLGLYQVVCGLMAFLLSFSALAPEVSEQNDTTRLLSATFFCGISVLSGILLLLKKPAGFPLTIINQLFQIPQIAFAGIVYRNVCGLGLLLGSSSFNVQPPHFSLFLNVGEGIVYFTINILAVALAIYSIVLMRKSKAARQEIERDNMDIGRNI